MTDKPDPLDGWEFGVFRELCGYILAASSDHGEALLWKDGDVSPEDLGTIPLPTLRAVLDELERRARAKWGETWGLPPGTCPRCRGNKVIPVYRPGSIDLADVDFGLGCLGGSPAGSGFDPCPECST